MGIPNVEVHGALYGTWWCDPPGVVQWQSHKSLNYLRYLQYQNIKGIKIANSGLIYTRRGIQNKQTAISKDTMKDYQSEEKFLLFKK